MTKAFQFIIDALKPYKWHLTGLSLIEVFFAINLSLRPYLLKVIIDRVESPFFKANLYYAIFLPATLYAILSILNIFIFRISDFLYLKMVPLFRNSLILESLKRIQFHPYSFFQSHLGGSIAARIAEMADAAQALINLTIYRFLTHSLSFLAACFTICYVVRPHFAVILITCSALFVWASYTLAKKPFGLAKKYLENYALLIGKLLDSIGNILQVILFVRQKQELSYLASQAKIEAKSSQDLQWVILLHQALASLFLVALISLILIYLIYLFQRDIVSVGEFILTLTITISIGESLQSFPRDLLKFSENLGKCALTLELINLPSEIINVPHAPLLKVKNGKIEFQKVCFSYQSNSLLFSDLSLIISAGEKVGLVGYSGSGKTTFINLILRLFSIRSGRILIDDQNIEGVDQNSLHENISYIPQEPILFNRSIWENIAYGKTNASDQEIIEAAQKAHAHTFIEDLPQKYHTIVGERGMMLSGGQRQQVSIARAILKDSKILILDEASSVLDPITEHCLQDSLQEVMKNKTILAIAHRLSTLSKMDRLLVFDKGRIVEDGNHQKLLEKSGVYSQLWKTQAMGY